jgi:hypothetical protein
MAPFPEVHLFRDGPAGFRRPPNVQYFRLRPGVPDEVEVSGEFPRNVNGCRGFVYGKIKQQVHFKLFLRETDQLQI